MKISDDPHSSDQAAGLKFSRRFCTALRRIAAPAASYAGFALGVDVSGRTEWICSHKECMCTSMQAGAAIESDDITYLKIFHSGSHAGFAILCIRGGVAPLSSIVQDLVLETNRYIDLEYEEEDLIHELGSNWESLNALFEVSSDLRASRNIPDILGRILDRIAAIQPNLHAVLWIEKEGRLKPIIARRAEISSERDMKSGVLGRAMMNRTPIIINDPAKIKDIANIESELSNAKRIAITPIATRERLVGVLEVWQEEGGGEFNTPTLRLFEALALQAAMVVESDRAYKVSLAEERLRREYEIGGRIQETLLSGRAPSALPGLSIGVLSVPSQSVDGDFFDFLLCSDDCLDVFIGDVMGKGIPAALVGAAAKSDLLRAFGQLTAANLTRQLPEPKDIVTSVHQHLTGQLIDIESFISLYYSRFDLRNRRMDFVDCGHPRAVHYRPSLGTLTLLTGDNMPLGVLEGGEYSQATVPFSQGDIFLFYSDGVTEAHDGQWELFGEERLKECIRANANLEPAELCAKVRESVAEFTGMQTVTDDLTCLAVKIGVLEDRLPLMRWAMEFFSSLEFLPALRAWVRGVFRCAGIDNSRFIGLLELAVTEAISNIIRHAYAGLSGKKIIIEAQVQDDLATITISHWGKRFRPISAAPAMPDATPEHGYGLYIISQVIDKVSYFEGKYGADCVKLEKYLGKETGGDAIMLATIEKCGEVTVVKVALDTLDAGNEKRFKKEVVSALAPNSNVVLDLGEVDFVDSSGLGAILSCYRHLQAAGGNLKLCGMKEQVRTLFELVRMHRIFDIYNTCEEALESFHP